MARRAIAKYYPCGCRPSEGFEVSREWKQQSFLRTENLPLHKERILKLIEQTNRHFPARAIDENSCVTLYPSYNLRILIEPSMGWPDQRIWNWDVKMIRRWKKTLWIDFFFSYLGPFGASVTSEFSLKGKMVLVRRRPAEWLTTRDTRVTSLLTALTNDWRLLPYPVLRTVVPDFATETRGLSDNTVFHLLFNDTFPEPRRWNSKWESIDTSPEEPLVVPEDEEDKPVAYLIPEAVLRNELGR